MGGSMNYLIILGILFILGLLSTKIMKKLNIPNVTGYLLTGLIVGLAGIGIDKMTNGAMIFLPTTSQSVNIGTFETQLSFLNEIVSSIALGFIAISIGSKIRFSKKKKTGRKTLTITIVQAVVTIICVDIALIALCLLLKLPIAIAICLGAIATATAPAATLMIIQQYKAKGPLVDKLLTVVAMDDAFGLMFFAISITIAKVLITGTKITFVSIVLVPLINILGTLLIGFVLGWLLKVFIKLFKSKSNRLIVLIAFTILGVGLCSTCNNIVVFGETLEFSNLLCCMMIGIVYNNFVKQAEYVQAKRDFQHLENFTPFLFMLFFILSGAHLAIAIKNMVAVNSSIIIFALSILVVYLASRTVGKYVGGYLGCKMTKQSKNVTNYFGITLFPQAGVAIGMATQVSLISAFSANGVGNIIVAVVLCATLVYEIVGPLLTKWALTRAGAISTTDRDEK